MVACGRDGACPASVQGTRAASAPSRHVLSIFPWWVLKEADVTGGADGAGWHICELFLCSCLPGAPEPVVCHAPWSP